MSLFQFLKNICGYKKLVSEYTMLLDLNTYYNIKTNIREIETIFNIYNNFLYEFWEFIKNNTIIIEPKKLNLKDNPSMKKYVEDGLYFNINSLDINKAVFNYHDIIYKDEDNVLLNFGIKIGKLKIPSNLKKYLYNYTFTNVVTKYYNESVSDVRLSIVNDVMRYSKVYGDILKIEFDGAYIQTKTNKYYPINLYGIVKLKKFKWMLLYNKYTICGGTNIEIKGLSKLYPNVYYQLISDILKCKSNYERETYINNFLYKDNYASILDWGFKTDDGKFLNYKTDRFDISIPTDIDQKELSIYNLKIDKFKYLNDIYDILGIIFSNIG